MGIDCKLIIDDIMEVTLDRWYVFSNKFEEEKEYTKQEFIYTAFINIFITIVLEMIEYINGNMDLAYIIYWHYILLKNINKGKKFKILTQNHDDYYKDYFCYDVVIKGKRLDNFGLLYNITRKKVFWIFKESDKKYRERIGEYVNNLNEELRDD